jgi:hypothetical protein
MSGEEFTFKTEEEEEELLLQAEAAKKSSTITPTTVSKSTDSSALGSSASKMAGSSSSEEKGKKKMDQDDDSTLSRLLSKSLRILAFKGAKGDDLEYWIARFENLVGVGKLGDGTRERCFGVRARARGIVLVQSVAQEVSRDRMGTLESRNASRVFGGNRRG